MGGDHIHCRQDRLHGADAVDLPFKMALGKQL
jgi:hypothetical protein